MKKILRITEDIVSIGHMDGSIQEVRPSDCTFMPSVGDLVEIFSNESKVIVTKVEPKSQSDSIQDKIHINIVNKNNNTDGNSASVSSQGKVVNKVTYCVLAILLGGFGAHKFYSGKAGMGLLYLFFCWTYIPAFVSLIEFFIALTKTSDANGNIVV